MPFCSTPTRLRQSLDAHTTLSEDPDEFRRQYTSAVALFRQFSDAPVYLTEWNFSTSHRDWLNDTCFRACFFVRNILENYDELESFGYNLVIYPTASTYVTTKAMIDLWEGLKRDGTTITQLDKMVPFAQFNELMGLQKIRDIEHTYASSTGR